VWSSSNEAVATADDQGHVRAVGTGSATITAADATQSSVSASAQVSVRAVSSWTGIELSTSSLTLQTGQEATVEAFLASAFKGRTVTWKLVPASLGTVTTSRDTLSATVTASSTEGSGTLRATVRNRYGRARSVSIPVAIEGEAARDFVIDASGVLTSYEGSSPDVTIPDTVTVIAPSAFDKARQVIRSVRIPASVREIQADAFASTALTSVTFDDTRDYPSQLTTVGERAFASTALTSIVLPGAVTTIGAHAFDGAMSLTELEIPDSVQYSGGLANTGLETVEFGTQIRKISSRGTSLTAPQHLIVRGGVQGVVDYEESASDTSLMSAFFGEGITDITLSGSFPSVVVLPSTTTQFALYSYLLGGRPDDIDVYVADAQGSPAWVTAENALLEARLDTARIHRYTPATVTVSGAGITEADDGYELLASVGTPTQITASVTGGVPGGYQMRATQVGADGTETRVLDWADMTANADSASALLSWNPTSSDTTLRIEVRDATHLRHPVTVALAGSPQPDPTPQVGSWSHNGSCWSYRYADGTVERSSTLTIDAQVYRFDANGCAKTGWVLDGDSWYYHSSTGAQQSGWLTLGTDTYYLDPTTGAMATGWFTDGGAWYYLQPGTGAMATGWVRIGWKWYHFSDTGQLL
jgi:putative cell wall binding repeat-containing domain protein